MALTSWSSANHLRRTSLVHNTYPFLISAWGNKAALTTTTAASIGISANENSRRALVANNSGTILPEVYDGTTYDVAGQTSAAHSTNVWFHMAAEFISTASRAALLNGANRGSSAVSSSPGTSDSLYIGALNGGSGTNPWGNTYGLAEVSIWNGTGMSNANLDSLALKLYNGGAAGAGGNPLNITAESSQPWTGKLVAYYTLLTVTADAHLVDASGNGHTLSKVGTLTNFASHPTIEAVSAGGKKITALMAAGHF